MIFWEDVIDALRAVPSAAFQSDLQQFEAMYKVLNRHIGPLATDVDALERQGDLVTLVDRLTRRFAEACGLRVLPMGEDEETGEDGNAVMYQRRYSCPPLGGANPCFSVGVRHPFAGQMTFIWLRFNRTTPRFALIHGRLAGSSLSDQLVESGGHLWLPLNVPLHTEEDGMITALYAQLDRVTQVAYASLAPARSRFKLMTRRAPCSTRTSASSRSTDSPNGSPVSDRIFIPALRDHSRNIGIRGRYPTI